jgi:glycosyltransferase involved in cell wall biosynthesis
MKIAFITRSTLYKVPGGDTIQVLQTVRQLRKKGVTADIFLTNTAIDYSAYDLFHFSNITRPSDILFHINRIKKPFALSPILIDYSEYDRNYRKGLTGMMLKNFRGIEYIKTVSRWLTGNDCLRSKSYLWKGHRQTVREILKKAAVVLPASAAEYEKLRELYGIENNHVVVPNGIDPSVFQAGRKNEKDRRLVLCAARIEGIKNQLNLIKALNDTKYTLMLIGAPAPNQLRYYEECRRIASKNIIFYNRVPQEILAGYYKIAKVHALPSWFETCGLSSLEAVAMGCNIAITERGYTKDYFANDAFYCEPGNPESIFTAVDNAANSDSSTRLQEKILRHYTWQNAATITLEACKNIISG